MLDRQVGNGGWLVRYATASSFDQFERRCVSVFRRAVLGHGMNAVRIREEQPTDHVLIRRLTGLAFKSMPFSDGAEPDIIDRLRAAEDLTISLVAEKASAVVGHVAFSPVAIGHLTAGWYGLGPVSVHPDEQRKGIGSSLIEEGLRRLRQRHAHGCALVGDPDYYSRFGFVSDGNVQYKALPAKFVQWISFGKLHPIGELVFRPAFGD